MANVFLVGLEQAAADQISQALGAQQHRITEEKIQNIGASDLRQADIIFAGGDPSEYLRLLRWVRNERPALPFVVITRIPQTSAWLDAIEAGATDFCSPPLETRLIRRLMQAISNWRE